MKFKTHTLDLPESAKRDEKIPTYREIIHEVRWALVFIGFVLLAMFAVAFYEEYFAEKTQFGRGYYVATFEMESAIGERHQLEKEVREIQGRNAQERVDNGSATERDHVIALEHTLERMS